MKQFSSYSICSTTRPPPHGTERVPTTTRPNFNNHKVELYMRRAAGGARNSMKNVNPIPASINTYHNHPFFVPNGNWNFSVSLEETAAYSLENNCDEDDWSWLCLFLIIISHWMEFQYFHKLPIVPSSSSSLHLVAYLHSRDSCAMFLFRSPNCHLYEGWNRSAASDKEEEHKRNEQGVKIVVLRRFCSSEDKSPRLLLLLLCRSQFMKFTVNEIYPRGNRNAVAGFCRLLDRICSFLLSSWRLLAPWLLLLCRFRSRRAAGSRRRVK